MSLRFPKDYYYSCFSPRVLVHLLENGFNVYKDEENNFFGEYLHYKTLKKCYVFLRTEELNKCIAEVSNRKE